MLAAILLILGLLAVSTVAQYISFDQLAPFFQKFDWHKKNDWISRINASVAVIGILLFSLISGSETYWGVALIVAYFIHDILHLLFYDHDITNYIHHIVGLAVVALRYTVMTPEQAFNTFLATCNLESTSPFIHATWLAKEAGYKDHPYFKYLAGFTLVFFGLMRVVVFPWLMYSKMDKVTAGVFSPFLGLNVYWFYKILRMAQKAFTNGGGERLV